jgi:hypothetical protein
MFAGGLGLCETMHVRLIVEPVSMYISGAPITIVIGSAQEEEEETKILIKLCASKF